MVKIKLEINGVSANEWDKFIYSTCQGNIFSTYDWLALNGESSDVRYITFHNDSRIVASIGLISREGSVAPPSLTQYNSLHLQLLHKPSHKNDSLSIDVQESLIDYLENQFNFVRLVHHPSIKDVRGFQWKKWKEKIKSTYLVNLEENSNELLDYRPSLRRQIQKKERKGFKTIIESDFDSLKFLLEQSFDRHNAKLFLDDRVFEKIVHKYTENNAGIQYTLKDGSKPISSVFFILDQTKVAYYFVAGNDSNYLSSGASSILLHDALIDLGKRGMKYLDFGGAHHPSIARFKSGFNPELVPYFEVSHERTK